MNHALVIAIVGELSTGFDVYGPYDTIQAASDATEGLDVTVFIDRMLPPDPL